MLGGGENICGWLFMMELITLGVSLHEEMAKLISVGRSLQLEQTAESFVILTACLFSFVAGEHEIQPSGTCYYLNSHC